MGSCCSYRHFQSPEGAEGGSPQTRRGRSSKRNGDNSVGSTKDKDNTPQHVTYHITGHQLQFGANSVMNQTVYAESSTKPKGAKYKHEKKPAQKGQTTNISHSRNFQLGNNNKQFVYGNPPQHGSGDHRHPPRLRDEQACQEETNITNCRNFQIGSENEQQLHFYNTPITSEDRDHRHSTGNQPETRTTSHQGNRYQTLDPQATLTTKEILTLSRKLGKWQPLAYMLEFEDNQVTKLKGLYDDSDELVFHMLKTWRDVVQRYGENSRLLLAQGLIEIENAELAESITMETKAARDYKIKENTKAAICSISFKQSDVSELTDGILSRPGTGGSQKGNAGFMKKKPQNVHCEPVIDATSKLMKYVGRIFSPQKNGTGFLVAGKYVFTAWHVVEAIIKSHDVQLSGIDYSRLTRNDVYLQFSSKEEDKHRFLPSVPFFDEKLDVAVLELKEPISEKNVAFSCHELGDADELHIIGFGHPQEGEKGVKQGDLKCKIIKGNSDEFRAASSWLEKNRGQFADVDQPDIDSAYLEIRDERFVVCDCFLQFGASGSPMVVYRDGDFVIVGVYTYGIPKFYWDRHQVYEHAQVVPEKYTFGYGALMTAIYAAMKDKEPAFSNIFPQNYKHGK